MNSKKNLIPKFQHPWRAVTIDRNQGTWGNRGQGNELQSAFEKGTSWIVDKIVNAGDYMDQGLAYVAGLMPGGLTAKEALQDEKNKQEAMKSGQLGYVNAHGDYEYFPTTGVAPAVSFKTPIPKGTLVTPDILVNNGDFAKGREMAAKFFEHPVVRESYKHNQELAKKIGLKLPDRNSAAAVRQPVRVKYDKLNDNEIANVTRTYFGSPDEVITMDWRKYPVETLREAIIHEHLHRGSYSAPTRPQILPKDYYETVFKPEYQFYRIKTKRLLKPEYWDDGYLSDALLGEAGPNLINIGRGIGLKLGQKYPGYSTAKEMLQNYNGQQSFLVPRLNDTKIGMKRIWDAMTGRYFTPIVGLGTGIYGLNKQNEQN